MGDVERNFLSELQKKLDAGGGQVEMARVIGSGKNTASEIMSGKRPLKLREVALLAEYYKIEGFTGVRRRIPIAGYVIDDSVIMNRNVSASYIDVPASVSSEAIVILVRDKSMAAYYEGDAIIFDGKVGWEEAPKYKNKECLIKTDDGRIVIRHLSPTGDIRKWTLEAAGVDPETNVLLEWVAPVVWVSRGAEIKTEAEIPKNVTETRTRPKKTRKTGM